MVRIDSTKFGEIVIDGKTYFSDMYVYWDGKKEVRGKEHVFGINELIKVMQRHVEAVVIGTGQEGIVKIAEEVKIKAEDKKIKIFVDKSPKAVDIFNGLVKDGKKAVAVIHTTC
jgi:hypothetical protein